MAAGFDDRVQDGTAQAGLGFTNEKADSPATTF